MTASATKWRYLNPGEVVREGDEYTVDLKRELGWIPVAFSVNKVIPSDIHGTFRRITLIADIPGRKHCPHCGGSL